MCCLFYILCFVMILNKYRIITKQINSLQFFLSVCLSESQLATVQFKAKSLLTITEDSPWDLGTIGFIEVSRNSFSLFLSQLPKFSINLSPQVYIFPALRRFFFPSHPSPLPFSPSFPLPLSFQLTRGPSFSLNTLRYH